MKLIEKSVLVIGATGGIGNELVRGLAKFKCRLALIGYKNALSEELKSILAGSYYHFWQCDIRSEEEVKKTLKHIIERFEKIDIIVFVAGIGLPMHASAFSSKDFENTIKINLIGAGYWLDIIIPHMLKNKCGTIVGISSMASFRGIPGNVAYGPSKAGFSNLFESLQSDLRPLGIDVILIEPGFVDTKMTASLPYTPFKISSDKAAKLILQAIEKSKKKYRFPVKMYLYAIFLKLLPAYCFDKMMNLKHVSDPRKTTGKNGFL